jgi:hypothetical protein
MFHQHNAGQYHTIKTANKSLKNVTKFKYLGKTLTDLNDVKVNFSRYRPKQALGEPEG